MENFVILMTWQLTETYRIDSILMQTSRTCSIWQHFDCDIDVTFGMLDHWSMNHPPIVLRWLGSPDDLVVTFDCCLPFFKVLSRFKR